MFKIIFILFSLYINIISAEKALTDYKIDEGRAPTWVNGDVEIAKHVVERWGVQTSTATCVQFLYKGSGGNFNNFPTYKKYEAHLKFTNEEKVEACKNAVKHEGLCTDNTNKQTRWYFQKEDSTPENTLKKGTCYQFEYNGCGGNANNFETEDECKKVCQNNVNGVLPENISDLTLFKAPNDFDCGWMPEVSTDTPQVGAVLDKSGTKCVYAAVQKDAKRGFFEHIAECVKTCIPVSKQVNACKKTAPFQVVPTNAITSETTADDFKEYFYYDTTDQLCKRFNSKKPTEDTVITSRENNIFESVEMCASYCPAVKQHQPLEAVNVCEQEKEAGKVASEDESSAKYKVPRWSYDKTIATGEKCVEFKYSGIGGNMNNFKSKTACDNLCKLATETA